jgi:hypothetical protein
MRTSLVVTPTQETIQRVQDIVQSTVLGLDTSLMAIEIAASEAYPPPEGWLAQPEMTYSDVQVKDVIVDTVIATNGAITRLVAACWSSQLNERRRSLGLGGVTQFQWVLKYDVPPGRSVKLTITHLTDILVYREGPFSFSEEMLLQV